MKFYNSVVSLGQRTWLFSVYTKPFSSSLKEIMQPLNGTLSRMNGIFCCQVRRIKGNATLRVSRDMGRSNRRLILTGLITVRPMHYDPWQQRTMKEPVSHFFFLWDSKMNWFNHLILVFQFHWRSPYAILLLFFHDEWNEARLSLWQSILYRRLTSYFPKQK